MNFYYNIGKTETRACVDYETRSKLTEYFYIFLHSTWFYERSVKKKKRINTPAHYLSRLDIYHVYKRTNPKLHEIDKGLKGKERSLER